MALRIAPPIGAEDRRFSCALPMNSTRSRPVNFLRYSAATLSLRWRFSSATMGNFLVSQNCSIRAMNALVIGSINALEANRWPRWNRKKLAAPLAFRPGA